MGLGELFRRVSYILRRERIDRELEEEMRLHLELRARALEEQGMARGAAEDSARQRFGNRTLFKENSMEMWGWTVIETLAQDIRFAARLLVKTPAFTVVSILTLAIGLGMNTAVFSIVNAVMLRPLPYPNAERLISLWEEHLAELPDTMNSSGSTLSAGPMRTTVSAANLMDYRSRTNVFDGLSGVQFDSKNLTGVGSPERLLGEAVNANFFSLLGVSPTLGRDFTIQEDRFGAAAVVILADSLWRRRFGADPNVLGGAISLDGRSHTVIGILPASFDSPNQFGNTERIEFYVPAAYSPELLNSRGDHELRVIGRLKPGVSLKEARAEIASLSAALERSFPQTNKGLRAAVAPLRDDIVRSVRISLIVLLGAASLVVLLTCVNVANLFLVRSASRTHETSVRFALGASRLRIVRQCLVEGLLVSGAGCLAGIGLGALALRGLMLMAPPGIPRLEFVSMDWRVFAVVVLLATAAGVLFAISPAWHASRSRPSDSLKSTERRSVGPSQIRWRSALTISEIAISVVLLIGAALLLKSFVTVLGVDLGFDPERVIAMNISLPESHYKNADARCRFFEQLETRVRVLAGVEAVAYANRMPLRGGWGSGVQLRNGQSGDSDYQAVSPGYFDTLGIPLVRGRTPTPQDGLGQPRVAVVNQAFARRFAKDADPIGFVFRRNEHAPWVSVVGIVNDIRRSGKTGSIEPQVYLPAAQTDVYPVRIADFAVRAAVDPRRLVNEIQRQVWAIDKDQPITNVRTLDEILTLSVAQRRFQTLLLIAFAAVAVAIAVIGIFGVLSYSVSQRTSELGLRMALGASPAQILGLVLKQSVLLVGAGVGLGLGVAYALSRYLQSLLFGVQPHDWRTYAGSAALLSLVALLASMIPARRGAVVDPVITLRYE